MGAFEYTGVSGIVNGGICIGIKIYDTKLCVQVREENVKLN